MRCSKCGYISFDHLESCRKCHKPMADGELKGTTYPAVVPFFLQLSPGTNVSSGFDEDMVNVLDPDLDLLAGDNVEVVDFDESAVDSEGISRKDAMQSSRTGEISLGDDFDMSFDAASNESDIAFDEEDLLLDTSRFEDVPVNAQAVQAAAPSVQLEIPEGLADISDLARPAPGAEMKSGLDADLDFDDLSFDDLDLSAGLGLTPPPAQSAAPAVDDDLDFDLDLGGVGEVDTAPPKKGSHDLPDFNLSLD